MFKKAKLKFIEIYKNVKFNENPKNSLEKLFAEKDFLDGLKNCLNPFDLVESFPLKGILLKINK